MRLTLLCATRRRIDVLLIKPRAKDRRRERRRMERNRGEYRFGRAREIVESRKARRGSCTTWKPDCSPQPTVSHYFELAGRRQCHLVIRLSGRWFSPASSSSFRRPTPLYHLLRPPCIEYKSWRKGTP